MNAVIRTVAGRILGGAVGAACAFLATRYGVTIGPDQQQHAVADLIGIGTFVFGVVYPIVHRWYDAKHNPVDAASPGQAQASRAATR